jgi:tetratricopeptide (TPR) repeat protein
MQKKLFIIMAVIGLIFAGPSGVQAAGQACEAKDMACREFAKFAEAEQFESIIEKTDANKTYSEAARSYIGQAYLMIAGRETNTPEQEEQFCLKALGYGATSAYMGLYFIHAGQNPEKAISYLKQYVATKPKDSVPYVLLGEAEMEKENYETANIYLREAKAVARGHSTNLDWMLFQVNYLLGDFAYASIMLDGALAQGQFINELRSLAADPRYADLANRPEFRKYEPMIKSTSAKAAL